MIFIAECSTPFLHTGFIIKASTCETPTAILGIFMLLFFVGRVLLAPFVLWHMVSNSQLWTDKTLYYGELGAVVFFLILNYFWFHKIAKMATSAIAGDNKAKDA